MTTFNKPILTTQGLAMLKSAISGSTKLSFTKVVFTSDDYSQNSDTDIASLTDVKSKDLTAKTHAFIGSDNIVKIRATASNTDANQDLYIRGYALYGTSGTEEELFAMAISDSPNYVPVSNSKQTSQVTYTFNFSLSETDSIRIDNLQSVDVTQSDLSDTLDKANSYTNSKIADIDLSSAVKQANQYTDNAVIDKASRSYVDTRDDVTLSTSKSYIDSKVSSIDLTKPLVESNAYTDKKISALDSNIKNFIDSKMLFFDTINEAENALNSAPNKSIIIARGD